MSSRRVLAVANLKGGSGKTTVATTLAGALAADGPVTLLDLDPQRASLGWAARRPAGLPAVTARRFRAGDELPEGRVVLDLPAGSRKLADALRGVDAVVVPIAPGVFDEDGTRRFLDRLVEQKKVRDGRREVVLVANRVRARSTAAERHLAFLATLGFPLAATLAESAQVGAASAAGRSVLDGRSAARRAEWSPLLAWLRGEPLPPAPDR